MIDFDKLKQGSPILLRGAWNVAYRDPAACYKDGTFYLYFTYAVTERNASGFKRYLHIGMVKSKDLREFTPVKILTPSDESLNYSSPGNIFVHDGLYYMCMQTYCTENGETYGNGRSRIYLCTSSDLEHWSPPELIRVKGDAVAEADMGRMIDAYVIQNQAGEWFCFFKQNGVSYSKSKDLKHWTFLGSSPCGENVCVVRDGDGYRLWSSDQKDVSVKTSRDLVHWEDTGRRIRLGQDRWEWAKGRLTAAFVIDLRKVPEIGKALMFFHGTGPYDETVFFNQYACLSVAWSDNLVDWDYPQGDGGEWKVDLELCSGR